MNRGNTFVTTSGNTRGGAFFKLLLGLIVVGVLGLMVVFVYFGWQPQDLTDIDGRDAVIKAREEKRDIMSTDIVKKLRNGYDGLYEVRLTEEELNRYIAHKIKMSQGGWMKEFATVKGVYVKLKKDEIEIFIEREIAQYGEDGTPNTEYIKPFDQTVSMCLKITTADIEDGKTEITIDFPGGTIGRSPAPGMFVKLVKGSFDQLKTYFATEVELGHTQITRIKIEDGYILLDPRKKRRTAEMPAR